MLVLIYGLGRSGLAAAKLAAKQGHKIYYFDQKPDAESLAIVDKLGAVFTDDFKTVNADICIAAPGVAYNHQDLKTLRQRGIETIGEVEWVFRTFNADMIGVTGTAGKGSITRWITRLLNSANIPAVAGGNIDPALSDVATEDKTLVVELSSFQLERCPTLKPSIAVISNLDLDHLDYHKTIEEYHLAKKNIIKNLNEEDIFIYNHDNETLRSWAAESKAKSLGFSLFGRADAYLKNGNIFLYDKPLISVKRLNIKAKHFLANAMAASLAAYEKGLSREQIAAELQNIETEKGRYSFVAKKNNINYIEDSIATRSLAVRAGLESTQAPIVWIAGGVNKGADFNQLAKLLREKVVLVLTIGQAADDFAKRASAYTLAESSTIKNGYEALKWAVNKAQDKLKNSGGTVLFAPLASSFDQFKDYKERAEVFRKIVSEIE